MGYSIDPHRRIIEHNTKPLDTYTSKHRPWKWKAVWESGVIEAEAIRIERFIKKQKSQKLVASLCNPDFITTGELAQLVSVPVVRD